MAHRQNGSSYGPVPVSAQGLATGLGWFSIGLGLAELLAPRTMARTLGMHGQENLIRAYGLREIATGVGILASKDPTPWILGRVAGDALDLATLAPYATEDNEERGNVGIAMGAVAGVTVLDALCAHQLMTGEQEPSPPPRDYSRRRGFPRPPREMKGVAAKDFETPRDMRHIPPAMEYPQGSKSRA
jgi:hypothetical protein